ncbi:MAG: endonuclease III [Acutalibacteraceae bacterium]|nr:endonuclease III [Acutalibacteraceae bacterium]
MTKKQRAIYCIEALEKEYEVAECQLTHSNALELLIATRLSAQCTDNRVNLVTPALFERYKTVDDYANAKVEEIESYIKSCGLYKTKAQDIKNIAIAIRDKFDGQVPESMEDLTSLSGVGRKTANLIRGDIYKLPAIVCDTHVIRITNLLGLTQGKDAFSVEKQLEKILPVEKSNDFCHRVVLHGRAVCIARRPKCDMCCLNSFCKGAKK